MPRLSRLEFGIYSAVLPLLIQALPCQAQTPKSPPARTEILAAMKKAATFMVEKVSYLGGYVWSVSEDFTKRYGEIPARATQIWVQDGTPLMANTFLDAYETTGDKFYLESARKAVNALIFGQQPMGGWHYFIDFDPKGVPEWYTREASRFKWGYEEYRHFYGNATFDDGTTAKAAGVLLRNYLVDLDPVYRPSVLKALDFVLMAQYPNGAWPQRFPLRTEFVHDGLPDYTSFYTLNDGVAQNNIELLVQAYEKLGDPRYLEAAKRGVNFLMQAQGPEGQAGWAEQFDFDMKPTTGRTHEPAGFVIRESIDMLEVLENFYKMTGDVRYLRPIPGCLAWFDRINKEAIEFKRPAARYYAWGTNLPVYFPKTEKTNAEGYGLYNVTNSPQGGEIGQVVDVAALRAEYERIAHLTPKQARAEYDAPPAPRQPRVLMARATGQGPLGGPGSGATPPAGAPPAGAGFRGQRLTPAEIIASMDARGAWLSERMPVLTVVPEGMNPGTMEFIRGYSTNNFARNLQTLIGALKAAR